MVAVVTIQPIVSANRFQFIKFKFMSLRDNVGTLLDFLHEIQNNSEAQDQYLQVLKIKTNFFIDEIDFYLRGDLNPNLLKEYFATYATFYHRSRTELIGKFNEMLPNRELVW